MIPDKIYEVGAMLGLERKDIQNIVSDKYNLDTTEHLELLTSPVDSYKDISEYGTVSMKDFNSYKENTLYGSISINDFQ